MTASLSRAIVTTDRADAGGGARIPMNEALPPPTMRHFQPLEWGMHTLELQDGALAAAVADDGHR